MQDNSYKKQVVLVLVISVVLLLVWGIYNYAKKNSGVYNSSQSGQNEGTLPYLHGDNSFLFHFPNDFKFVNNSEDVNGETQETVIFNSTDPKRGFQVFIAPFDSKSPFSLEDIKGSNTELEISDSKNLTVGGEKSISFLSKIKGTNFSTLEIWLIHEGKIYQISTYPEFEAELLDILPSWKWQ